MISIIIPTYNEEKNIEKFQKQFQNIRGNYEIIFSDGYSSDRTYELITYKKIQCAKGRSNQMNKASELANGEYLLFLHADCILDEQAIEKIEESNADIGCFRIVFDENKILLKILSYCSCIRVKWRNIAFGDQGIFIKKELFEKINRYENLPLMEDYALSIKLKNLGYKYNLINLPIIASSRRLTKNGILKMILKMQMLQHRYRKGYNIYNIAKDYER